MLGVFIWDGVGVAVPYLGVDPANGVFSCQLWSLAPYPGLTGVYENLLGVIPGLRGVLSLACCLFWNYSLILRPPRGVASHLVLFGAGVSGV